MSYNSLKSALEDLVKTGQCIEIKEEVDPELEMAAIHRRICEKQGPALWFKNVKNSPFTAASNIFGTMDRAKYLFRHEYENVKLMVRLKSGKVNWNDFSPAFIKSVVNASCALPWKSKSAPVKQGEALLSQLPQLKCWKEDGGSFITLPLVYSENPEKLGWKNSNLGMYRIQISGNEYRDDKECGLHYQIHRGIGIHHQKSLAMGKKLPVSIFIGGPPAHTLAAIMPLPEKIPELAFAGVLAGRRFRYHYHGDHLISNEADFCITGYIAENEKPEGPFGDHLGYYSLTHPFPYLEIENVFHRKDAVFPFTVVGRPPQEDSVFGELIHDLTGDAVSDHLPGVHEILAVDESGVHPLLLAVGQERYTPYSEKKQMMPQEILTQANMILGFGQCSLAKYLIITTDEKNMSKPEISCAKKSEFFQHILKRVRWERDLHFYTSTTIDTLDYSGESLNRGSKLVIAAHGTPFRILGDSKPKLPNLYHVNDMQVVLPGVLAFQLPPFLEYSNAKREVNQLCSEIENQIEQFLGFPLIILCDDSKFCSKSLANFLWVSFTRSNPSHDIYGVYSFYENKHWGCKGPLLIDARKKPHHAAELSESPEIQDKISTLFSKGGSLFGY